MGACQARNKKLQYQQVKAPSDFGYATPFSSIAVIQFNIRLIPRKGKSPT